MERSILLENVHFLENSRKFIHSAVRQKKVERRLKDVACEGTTTSYQVTRRC